MLTRARSKLCDQFKHYSQDVLGSVALAVSVLLEVDCQQHDPLQYLTLLVTGELGHQQCNFQGFWQTLMNSVSEHMLNGDDDPKYEEYDQEVYWTLVVSLTHSLF